MMIKGIKKKFNNVGFMLVELLVVIAIIAILAGVSFVSVGTYIRGLQALEMDETAKELFIAAQNHLSSAYASGEYQEALKDATVSSFGTVISKPSYINDVTDTKQGEHEYRVICHTGSTGATTTKPTILNYMLPEFAIDSEISDNGNYMIVYEANSATILATFYSGNPHTAFGSKKIFPFSDSDVDSDAIKEAVTSRDKRKNFLYDTVIGRFVGENIDIITGTELEPLTLVVTNGNKLTATITNPNYSSVAGSDNSAQIVTLTVTGQTSGNSKTIQLTNAATINYDLDDITTNGGHFKDKFCNDSSENLIPGEDIDVVAKLSDNSRIARPVESNHVIDNSIFSSYNRTITSDGSYDSNTSAMINNIRHLENLDPNISSFVLTAKDKSGETATTTVTAKQIIDINYAEFVNELGTSVYNSSNAATTNYYGISNNALIAYEGANHKISNIISTGGDSGNSGIFGTVTISGDNTFEVNNLEIADGSFNSSTIFAGSLIGQISTTDTTKTVTLYNVKVSSSKSNGSVVTSATDVGGLVGVSTANLSINKCKLNGEGISISTSGLMGDAGGFAGSVKGNLTVENSYIKEESLNIQSTNTVTGTNNETQFGGQVGGFAGYVEGQVVIDGCYITDNTDTSNAENISASESNSISIVSNSDCAGGLIGYVSSDLTISNSYINSKNLSTAKIKGSSSGYGSSGGLVGEGGSTITINNSSAIGEFLVIDALSAGGIVGSVNNGSAIKDTYCSSYVYASTNAGGFIGSIEGGTNTIERCYASGHTTDGKYATRTSTTADSSQLKNNYNVQSSGNAGGFIGNVSYNTTISNSYTTCSVYSSSASATNGAAGGFVGSSTNLTVNNCYSAGLVGVVTNGTVGGFAGKGNLTAGDSNNYYLKGKYTVNTQSLQFNDYNAIGSGTANNIKSTSGSEIACSYKDTLSSDNAYPWDTSLENNINSHTIYPYKTVGELDNLSSDNDSSFYHYGDWQIVEEDSSSGDFIRNAEKLAVILRTKDLGLDTDVSMLVEGLESKKDAFAMYHISNTISQYSSSDAKDKIQAAGGSTSNDPEMINPKRDKNFTTKTINGGYEHYVFLDDITTPERGFDEICDSLVPGEDIRITIKAGVWSWSDLKNFATTGTGAKTGITNSLFADGSYNSNYTNAAYYSDLNPDYAIVDPVAKDADAYANTALITNFRHLQNLDSKVSDVNDEHKKTILYTKAKICKDLYWKSFAQKGTTVVNQVPTQTSDNDEYFIDFITAINNDNNIYNPSSFQEVRIYGEDSDKVSQALATNNSFYGIVNNYITDFDGQNHSINNLVISLDGNTGLFRKISSKSGTNVSIHDLYINYPVVTTSEGDAGALIGYADNEAELLHINNLSMTYPKVTTTNGNAGAIIGHVNNEKKQLHISNSYINEPIVTNSNGDVGAMIGYVDNNGTLINVNNSSIVEPIAYTEYGNAGSVIGHIENDGELKAECVYSYGRYSVIRSIGGDYSKKDANAGGFIGKAYGAKYTISNCGAASYVYSDGSSSLCAGGFIGDFKPKSDSTFTSCFVGGHVGTYNTNYYSPDYVDMIAIDSNNAVTYEGGYNVCGRIASGGFFGYIGTSDSNTTKFENCFTTASVNALGKISNPPNKQGQSAVGGFVGRIQPKLQTYKSCYAAGRIFDDCGYVGGFAAHMLGNSDVKPTFENVSVLHGNNFNDDRSLQLNYFGSTTPKYTYSVTEISFVDYDEDNIANKNPSSIKVTKFNANNDEYPYKDNSYDQYGKLVYYGDWVKPGSINPLTISNGNRLKANILLNEKTASTELVGTSSFNATFIKLVGVQSKITNYYKVLYNNDATYIYWLNGGNWDLTNTKAIFNSSSTIKSLDFIIDNISGDRTNYNWSMQPNSNSWPGEDVTISISPTYADLDSNPIASATANSLFEKIEANSDGTNTYTAYISNSRNLENLNANVSNINQGFENIKITRAVQTDNIYWADDGTYGTSSYTAKIQPYTTEINNASIYQDCGNALTSAGKYYPLNLSNLIEYDGRGYTLFNFNMDSNGSSGIFATNNSALTIKNLSITNPTINLPSTNSVGALIGTVTHDLTLENILVNGTTNITGDCQVGGLIGYVSGGDLSISKSSIYSYDGIISNKYSTNAHSYNGGTGGLIGRLNATSINISDSLASVYVDGSGNGVGGFIGYIEGASNASSITRCYASGHTVNGAYLDNTSTYLNNVVLQGHYNVIGENAGAVGGFIGDINGNVTIEKCFSTNSLYSVNTTGYVGGFAGKLGNSATINNCYTISYISPSGSSSYYGGFIGQNWGNSTITDTYYYNNSSSAIANNSQSSVDITRVTNSSYKFKVEGSSSDGTLSAVTYRHDNNSTESSYTYKNWTVGADDNISFFGDWMTS